MKKPLVFLFILFTPLFIISQGSNQNFSLSDTSSYKSDRWLKNIRFDVNIHPFTQRELVNEYTPAGQIIKQPYANNTFLFSASLNYRNDFFIIGAETLSGEFNGGLIGFNALFWNYLTDEIDFFITFRGGKCAKGRFDPISTNYWGFGGEFYVDNIHIGFSRLFRKIDNQLEPNLINRYNLFLTIGYSFNRNTFKKNK